jgi:cell division protein FtsZ
MQTEKTDSIIEVPAVPTGPAIRIFGVGNAGITLLATLATPEFAGAEFAAVNTDAASLAASGATVKIHLENKLLRGLGSGGDPDRSRALAEEQFSTMKTACTGANVVFIVSGLGGGAGSGISPVLARAAREAGALVLAFVTLPFDCEGNRREGQALQSLEQLKSAADGVICLPAQKIFKLHDDNTGALEIFRLTGEFLIEGLRGVWQLLTRPGLIQVHFNDLCGLLRDRHAESVFACVESSGPARSRDIVEKILSHPLLEEGRALADSEAVLVNLTGSRDLTMAEISRVMEQIKRQCGKAQIIMGAALDGEWKNKLSVTVIAAKANLLPLPSPAATAPGTSRSDQRVTLTGARESREQRETMAARGLQPRRAGSKLVQPQLPLTIVSKGRFDKSEPTLHHGEDLDVPTFIRRGVPLN